ncbi:hypothetical protein [Candidatus Azobacteroides pseudotrichonymphae]|nr:hypothetical protein [Candidatus Azobacteroides pseudotrichonymphae]
MKAKKLLTLIFFSAICFGVGAKAAKKEIKPELIPAQTEEVKQEQERDHYRECPFLGKPFSKKQVSYRSVADKGVYIVDLGDDMYAIYKKGVTDKEGISDETTVEIFVIPIIGR